MRSPAPADTQLPPSTLTRMPAEVNRSRVLSSAQSAELVGFSIQHFRRLYRSGKAPKPVQLGGRKFGWRLGTLIDWIEAKSTERAA